MTVSVYIIHYIGKCHKNQDFFCFVLITKAMVFVCLFMLNLPMVHFHFAKIKFTMIIYI